MLSDQIDRIRSTIFRQTLFAEFELKIHELVEQGQPLTPSLLNQIYSGLLTEYYGASLAIDPELEAEWSRIPHFYYNFYVYQYATAFTASAALSEQVLAGDKAATNRYIEFLSSGSSDYAISLLKKAGVDMTTSQPLELTMKKMNRVIDEMEKILDTLKR